MQDGSQVATDKSVERANGLETGKGENACYLAIPRPARGTERMRRLLGLGRAGQMRLLLEVFGESRVSRVPRRPTVKRVDQY